MKSEFSSVLQKSAKLFSAYNLIAISAIFFAFLKVKALSSTLPLKETDHVLYWSYLFLVIPNILSLGLSVDVYRQSIAYKDQIINKLFHQHVLLTFIGGLLTIAVLFCSDFVSIISVIGIFTVLNFIANIPVASIDTLLGLKRGPFLQQVMNLLRSNLWVILLFIFYYSGLKSKLSVFELFLLSYLLATIIILLTYKILLGHLGELNYQGIVDSLNSIKSIILFTNNLLIQNKDAIIGFAIRTFIITRINAGGLLIFMSVFDILINLAVAFANNEFLKNYNMPDDNLKKKNFEYLKFLFFATLLFLIILNLFNKTFVYLVVGKNPENFGIYIFYFSVYTLMRFLYACINQLILLRGDKVPWLFNTLSFIYFVILLKFVPPGVSIWIIFLLLLIDILIVCTFVNKRKYNPGNEGGK